MELGIYRRARDAERRGTSFIILSDIGPFTEYTAYYLLIASCVIDGGTSKSSK